MPQTLQAKENEHDLFRSLQLTLHPSVFLLLLLGSFLLRLSSKPYFKLPSLYAINLRIMLTRCEFSFLQ